jgi:hypothetical protein
MQPASAWLEYPFRKSHPILRWLPSKLAAWISDNHGQELGIPPKGGLEWTAGELNAILENNLVPSHGGKGQLRTFCCIQWECELYVEALEGPRHDTIHSTWQATTFEERTVRYRCSCNMISYIQYHI